MGAARDSATGPGGSRGSTPSLARTGTPVTRSSASTRPTATRSSSAATCANSSVSCRSWRDDGSFLSATASPPATSPGWSAATRDAPVFRLSAMMQAEKLTGPARCDRRARISRRALLERARTERCETARMIAPAVGEGALSVVPSCSLCELHPGESRRAQLGRVSRALR